MRLYKKQIKLLDYLIETLGISQEGSNNKLHLDNWIKRPSKDAEVAGFHPCGTAACICGYVAIRQQMEYGNYLAQDKNSNLIDEASYVAEDLESILGVYLAESVYGDRAEIRKAGAIHEGNFTKKQLDHPHLNSESSFTHAISYLEMIRDNYGIRRA
jgi:hypothetical protein